MGHRIDLYHHSFSICYTDCQSERRSSLAARPDEELIPPGSALLSGSTNERRAVLWRPVLLEEVLTGTVSEEELNDAISSSSLPSLNIQKTPKELLPCHFQAFQKDGQWSNGPHTVICGGNRTVRERYQCWPLGRLMSAISSQAPSIIYSAPLGPAGTQAVRISQTTGKPQISTGDMLREAVRRGY